jgi:type IV pilus assembly protein PilY1
MWEFTSADDPNLGLTFSQPSIVKLHDGNWWAVFGNGYNSTNGTASLFLLRLDHTVGTAWTKGTDYIRIDAETTTAANGLSTPALVDLDGDATYDAAYAGDLQGNMWKFDLSSSTAANWKVAYSGAPLFIAKDPSGNLQPITDQPDVGNNLLIGGTGQIVYFGTGRYLISSDNSTTGQNTQTLYAIFDENYSTLPTITRYPATSSNLVAQTFTTSGTTRTSTSNSVSTTGKYGWYMDLIASGATANGGERAVANPVLRNGLIFFITLIPSTDPCSFGGGSWIMELNALSGAPPQNATNSQSGVEDTTGVLAGLTFLANGNNDVALGSDTSGQVQVYYPPANGRVGRVTWRELIPAN